MCPLFLEKCPLFSEKSPLFFEKCPLFLWYPLRSCASTRNVFIAAKTRYCSRDNSSVENCEFHLYSTLSRVRAHVSGQEFIVFCCHICHRNQITHCELIGWWVLMLILTEYSLFFPHFSPCDSKSGFDTAISPLLSPQIALFFRGCDRCDRCDSEK